MMLRLWTRISLTGAYRSMVAIFLLIFQIFIKVSIFLGLSFLLQPQLCQFKIFMIFLFRLFLLVFLLLPVLTKFVFSEFMLLFIRAQFHNKLLFSPINAFSYFFLFFSMEFLHSTHKVLRQLLTLLFGS